MNKGEGAQGYPAARAGSEDEPQADASAALGDAVHDAVLSGGADLRFLAALSHQMRLCGDSDELAWSAVQSIGRHLRLSRCSLVEVDEDAQGFKVHRDYRDPGDLASATGVYSLSAYPPDIVGELIDGRIVAVTDTTTNLTTASFHASAYEPLSVRAFVAVPFLRRGRWVAALVPHMTGLTCGRHASLPFWRLFWRARLEHGREGTARCTPARQRGQVQGPHQPRPGGHFRDRCRRPLPVCEREVVQPVGDDG